MAAPVLKRRLHPLNDGDEITAEYDGSGNLLRRYVRGPSEDQPIAWYEGSGTANRQWLLENPQGSIIAVTNSSSAATTINAYDEYGLPGSGNSGRFQYTGQAWIPEVGLYNYKARIYSPNLGRFMQTDPIGYGDGMNIYAYVHGDPVNLFDPTGTDGDPTGPDIVVHAQPNPDDSGSLADLTNLSRPTYAPLIPISVLRGAPQELVVKAKKQCGIGGSLIGKSTILKDGYYCVSVDVLGIAVVGVGLNYVNGVRVLNGKFVSSFSGSNLQIGAGAHVEVGAGISYSTGSPVSSGSEYSINGSAVIVSGSAGLTEHGDHITGLSGGGGGCISPIKAGLGISVTNNIRLGGCGT